MESEQEYRQALEANVAAYQADALAFVDGLAKRHALVAAGALALLTRQVTDLPEPKSQEDRFRQAVLRAQWYDLRQQFVAAVIITRVTLNEESVEDVLKDVEDMMTAVIVDDKDQGQSLPPGDPSLN